MKRQYALQNRLYFLSLKPKLRRVNGYKSGYVIQKNYILLASKDTRTRSVTEDTAIFSIMLAR